MSASEGVLSYALAGYGAVSFTAFGLFAALCFARVEMFKAPHPWARALAFSLLLTLCWPAVIVVLISEELNS